MKKTDANKQHLKFMDMAIECSHRNLLTNLGGPFGAVIVKNGKLIACEGNTVTSSNDPTAHAEVNAIRAACKVLKTPNLEGCVMYTSCEPCPMCTSAIYWAKIGMVYYGNTKTDAEWAGFSDTQISAELGKPLDERKVEFKRIGASKAIAVFEEWMQKTEAEKEDTKKGTL
jgi:guanine deaminase